MNIYQLKIEGFNCPSSFIIEKSLQNHSKKSKLKFEISNSGKSVYFPEQTIVLQDENTIHNITKFILKLNNEILLTHEKDILTLKSKYFTKLIIEHDIILDVYTDNSPEEAEELSNYFKSISVYHKVDEKLIFEISAQKCLLEFEHINEIIRHINYGSSEKSELTMFDGYSYTITQRQGYQKFLK